ncbi:cytochrome C oxidase subunit IV family protein [Flavobacterium sp. HJJ]|uniref:cytochrome C oxidase subunit IV family protein n=1 Tax=Flavobacterium sp. HJJ TaxID=2783792 RepID=UPI00188DA833|nr:cytochrome C oxidase subunit IV family protein [Flavobacterium sp. HJJ]MBF4471021.1 cytochrome C oxidase subunit IV family protein [Flavobacterium sp. HJJ]
MRKSLILIYILLLIITFTVVCVAEWLGVSNIVAPLIMFFAVIKFLLVAFQFMELKKAHSFWKISLTFTLVLFTVLVISLKQKS